MIIQLLAFFVLSLSSLAGETFWAILLGDVEDVRLGEAVDRDLLMMRQHAYEAAKHCGMRFAEVVLSGESANQESIHALTLLPIRSEDVVLFYWSGHGIRTTDKTSPFPFLHLGKTAMVALDDVIDHFHAKAPRLLVVIADCCNTDRPSFMLPEQLAFKTTVWTLQSCMERLYQSLYLQRSGTIVMLSASPGGKSSASTLRGSLFTRSFLIACSDALLSDATPSWETLFDETKEKVMLENNEQEPLLFISE